MYQKALLFATEKHDGQIRKFNGEPYVNHPIRVANTVNEFTLDEDIIAAALLHDVIEDTNATETEIREKFGDNVANMVLALTSDKEKIKQVGKTKYLLDKMNELSDDELLIKLADRLDNVSDLSKDNEKWSIQYTLQTDMIITMLNNPNIKDYHITLMNRIRSKILASMKTQ